MSIYIQESRSLKANKTLALLQYLSLDDAPLHYDAIHSELTAHLRQIPPKHKDLVYVLAFGDPHLVKILLDKLSASDLLDVLQMFPGLSILAPVAFKHVKREHRIALLDLLEPYLDPKNEKAARLAFAQAAETGDPDLFRRLVDIFHKPARSGALLDRDLIRKSSIELAPFWAEVFEQIDTEADYTQRLAKTAIQESDMRCCALLLRAGYSLQSHLRPTDRTNHMIGRLSNRISSAHGAIEILASLPSLEEIFLMPEEHIKLLMAGPSARQRKKMDKAAKAAKNLAGWRAHLERQRAAEEAAGKQGPVDGQ